MAVNPYGRRLNPGSGWWCDITPRVIRRQFVGIASAKRARQKAKRDIRTQLEEI